jgi:outer membrane protein assembly factor BamD
LSPVHAHTALLQPLLQAGARILGEQLDQGLIQALTGQRIGDFSEQMFCALCRHRQVCGYNAGLILIVLQIHADLTGNHMSLPRHLVLILPLLLLAGCGSSPDEDPTTGMTVEELYDKASEALKDGDYETAINDYERLESRFPYGPYAERAQLEIIYAYYKFGEPETAILSADRFIKLHPNHRNVDYAYYMRGLASFRLEPSWLNRVFDQDMTERDPRPSREAFRYFSELVKKFPDSRYAEDAIGRMYTLRDGLAQHELHVANFYLEREALVAAVNRAKRIVEDYQQTDAVPNALGILVRAYRKLELNDLADDALKVLELNYPDHDETKKIKAAS